jgi:fructose-1,6-bisphosphatase/inositol monophosphatase family enzyme
MQKASRCNDMSAHEPQVVAEAIAAVQWNTAQNANKKVKTQAEEKSQEEPDTVRIVGCLSVSACLVSCRVFTQ